MSTSAFTPQSLLSSVSLQVFLHVGAVGLQVLPTHSTQENADEGSGQGHDWSEVLSDGALLFSKYIKIFSFYSV